MNLYLVLLLLAIVPIVGTEKASTEGVINVQIEGRLVTVRRKAEGEAETVTYYVHAEGRDLLLDCSSNAAAQKALNAELKDRDPFSSTAYPPQYVQLKGRLKFRPNVKTDEKGKRVEQKDTMPVIIVDSLVVNTP